MATNTTNNYFSKPAVGGDTDSWGTTLNANWDTVDSVLAGDTDILALSIVPAAATDVAATFSGLVGIGTDSPDQKGHISGAGTQYLRVENTTNGVVTDFGTTSTGSTIINRSAHPMSFYTNSTEKMRIDASGNVGIGTASPEALLHIGAGTLASEAKLKIENDDGYAPTLEFNQAGTGAASIAVPASTNALQFNRFNGSTLSESMRIDASGNVGIGETNPADKLQVTDGSFRIKSTFPRIYLEDTNNSSDYSIINNNGQFGIYDDTNTTYRMQIAPSGNVGIGISAPSHKLHVSGSNSAARFSDDGAGFGLDIEHDTANGITTLQQTNSGGDLRLQGGSSSGLLLLETSGSERMRIDASGNLLVGRTSDDYSTQGLSLRNSPTTNSSIAAFTRDGSNVASLNRLTNDGTLLTFYKDSSQIGSIGTVLEGSARYFYIGNNALNSGIGFYTTGIYPSNGLGGFSDNSKDLGSSTVRWDDVYATNGTIQTSDRNEKQDIRELLDAEQRVATACKGLLRAFKWNSAVEEKGDEARIHFGIIAQDLQDAFTAEGLDADDYAMFINSTWTDEETGEERSRMGVRYSELLAFIISAI